MTTNLVYQSDAFVDAIGVNVHAAYGAGDATSSYLLDWVPLLATLGVRHVRDSFAVFGNARALQQTIAQRLAAQGMDVLYILDTPGIVANEAALLIFLASGIPQPGGVEPWNEYDVKAGYQSGNPPQWVRELIAFQPVLYTAVKAVWPTTAVISSAVSNNILSVQAGSLLPNADAANIHLYGPPALTPEYSSLFAPSKMAAYGNQAPGKPLWITETGLITGTMVASNLKTTELAAARILPRMLLYSWAPIGTPSITSAPAPIGRGGLGAERVYMYELLDDHDSTATATNAEDRYGLFKSDLSPKMAATAISNLLGLLADPGVDFAPQPLTVTASGPHADRFELLAFQKRDGSYWLAFWMGYDVTSDPIGTAGQGSGTDLPDTTYAVPLQFSQAFQESALYRPLYGSDPVQQSGALSAVTVQARLDVQVLRLSGKTRPGVRARGMRSYYDSRPGSLG
jgi:hypothetical protein